MAPHMHSSYLQVLRRLLTSFPPSSCGRTAAVAEKNSPAEAGWGGKSDVQVSFPIHWDSSFVSIAALNRRNQHNNNWHYYVDYCTGDPFDPCCTCLVLGISGSVPRFLALLSKPSQRHLGAHASRNVAESSFLRSHPIHLAQLVGTKNLTVAAFTTISSKPFRALEWLFFGFASDV